MKDPVQISPAALDKLRKRIHQDVENFLANGGVITVVPEGVTGIKALQHSLDEVINDLEPHDKDRVRSYGIFNKEMYLK